MLSFYKVVVFLSMVLVLGACTNASSNNGGGNSGHGIDANRFPVVNNTIYGGWYSEGGETDGIHISQSIYFNQSGEAGMEVICSVGSDNIVTSAITQATFSDSQIQITQAASHSESGTLGGRSGDCTANLDAVTMSYQVAGDVMTLWLNGESRVWNRIR